MQQQKTSAIIAALVVVFTTSATAWYPKARVEYVDPKDYTAEMKCCMGDFKTRIRFNDYYKINSFIVSSHVRNYTSGLEGVYEAQINLTVKDHYNSIKGVGYFKGLVNSTTLVDVPMVDRSGGTFLVLPELDYIIEVWYGGNLTYPIFSDYDLSIGPIASMQTLIAMGVDYERYPKDWITSTGTQLHRRVNTSKNRK